MSIFLFDFVTIKILDDEPDPENEIGDYVNLMKEEEDYQNDERQTDTDAEIGVKKFIEEFTVEDLTKVARPLENDSQSEPNLYHCSECNINFPSIQDHINSCHKGQEVIFQVLTYIFL